MKKLILTAVAVLFATMGVSAQGSKAFDKGYRGSVNAGGDISVTKDWPNTSIEFTTSHGYSFGDGMYIGAGIGLNLEMSGNDVGIPVFFDVKYNILDWKLSPYIDCRMGVEFMTYDYMKCGFMASPGMGFDYRDLSLRVGYKCLAGAVNSARGSYFKLNIISLSAAINF